MNMKNKLINSFCHIDISKPEINKSILKPFLYKGRYVDIGYHEITLIRKIYYNRIKELEKIRIKKAKIFAIEAKTISCEKQLIMLKNSNPIKYKNIDPKKLCKKFEKL